MTSPLWNKRLIFLTGGVLLLVGILVFVLWLPSQYYTPVMAYHSVASSWHEPLNNVQAANFEKQMSFLKARGYKVLTVDQFAENVRCGKRPVPGEVVVSFDDGYRNNYTAAYPILKKYGVPATIFVEVGHLGDPGYLTWDDVRRMDADGIAIQSHTMTGAYLPGLRQDELLREVTESKRQLEARLGRTVDYIAYPIGGFSEDIKELVRQAGYKAAFATNRGYDRTGKDIYEVKRIRIKDSDGELQLWLKLSGYYNLFREKQKPF